MFKFIFSTFLLFIGIMLFGQTNAILPTDGGYVQLSKNGGYSVVQNYNRMNTVGYSMANRKGELLFYGDGFGHHYNKHGKKLWNSDKIYNGSINNGAIAFQISNYEYMLIYGFDTIKSKTNQQAWPISYAYSIIDMRLDNGNGGITNTYNIPFISGISNNENYYCPGPIKVIRKFNFNYQIYCTLNGKIYSINYDKRNFEVLDSFTLNHASYVPESIRNSPGWQHNFYFTISPSNNTLLLFLKSNKYQQSFPHSFGSNYLTLEKIYIDSFSKFDVLNKKHMQIHQFDWRPLINFHNEYEINYFSDDAFSDNDTFLYFHMTKSRTLFHSLDSMEFEFRNNVYQLSYQSSIMTLNEIDGISTYSQDTFFQLKKGIEGEILCLLSFQDSTRKKIDKIGTIINSNSESCYLSDFREINLNGNMNNLNFQFQVPEQIRLTESISYDCDANISYLNLSNFYQEFDSFIWHLSQPDGGVDTFIGHSPSFSLSKNGDYGLRVEGISHKGYGYNELYFDTLHIRIPEKPVAAFTVSDTLACRFAPVQFFNTSRFNAVKPGEKVIFLWDFGDGESLQTSSTLTFSHAYVKAGTYTASLTILNGYCDSTLIRNAYIRITDAPNPGFTVSAQQGCAPLSVLFIDTVLHNVTRKEYFYSDSELWKPVVSTQFNHTFDTPGQFYAVQRLYGNTGCITQTDTQYFYVSQGLTSNDTSHTSLATYNGNQSIKIEWDTLDAAVLYALYKSNDGMLFPTSPYAITSSNSFSDPINSPGPLAYKVKGIDSCGNYSASGHIAKPVLLTGKALPDNSAAILSFTPYEQWQDTQIQYTLSYRDNNQWLDLTEQQQFHQFKDPNYARTDAFEKCYRIRASNNSLHSLSNEICIPYMPFVFMPNAFSPNDDGLNDAFKPLVYGLTSVKISIYNRWGEKLTDLSLGEAWQPKDIMPGAYVVTFTGKAHNGKDFFLKETVWVVR